jgi:regulator of protease activity HflC (stomatin/prohibitin superfamily)
LEADGRLEASRRDAEAQVVLAEASQKAIAMVSSAVGDQEIPVSYLLGEQYIKAMQDMSKSNNAKTVVLPADVLNTIRGIMGRDLK